MCSWPSCSRFYWWLAQSQSQSLIGLIHLSRVFPSLMPSLWGTTIISRTSSRLVHTNLRRKESIGALQSHFVCSFTCSVQSGFLFSVFFLCGHSTIYDSFGCWLCTNFAYLFKCFDVMISNKILRHSFFCFIIDCWGGMKPSLLPAIHSTIAIGRECVCTHNVGS